MKLNNLVQIANYEAGKNGNLLVSLDDELCIKLNANVEKSPIKLMIAGAKVTNDEAIKHFEEMVDNDTPCNMVIVVNSKFMKLSNKKQLALLQYQNLKLQERNVSHECDEYAEVAAAVLTRKYHGRAANVIHKAMTYKERGEKKAAKALIKQDKADEKQAKKVAKANAKAAKKTENANTQSSTPENAEPAGQPA